MSGKSATNVSWTSISVYMYVVVHNCEIQALDLPRLYDGELRVGYNFASRSNP